MCQPLPPMGLGRGERPHGLIEKITFCEEDLHVAVLLSCDVLELGKVWQN